jgi:hypothetical protein
MANITMNFDTSTKAFDVYVNNMKLDNVDYLSLYSYGEKGEIEIGMGTPESEDGMRVVTRIMATNKDKVKSEAPVEDFPEVNSEALSKAAFEFLGKEYPKKS